MHSKTIALNIITYYRCLIIINKYDLEITRFLSFSFIGQSTQVRDIYRFCQLIKRSVFSDIENVMYKERFHITF